MWCFMNRLGQLKKFINILDYVVLWAGEGSIILNVIVKIEV